MEKLTYATTNKYKLKTANAIFGQYTETQLVGLPDGTPDVLEIQADTQEEVAVDKAQKYYDAIGEPLVVMDSGLFINELGGFPGVYTKYVLETIGIRGLVRLIEPLKDRTAYTMRTIAYADGSTVKTFSSRVDGVMQTEERGANGWDYDKLLVVPEHDKTIAELTDDEKAALTSHAWKDLAEWIEER